MNENKEVAVIIRTCLNQKINFDETIDDTGREWWYVSHLYGPMDSAGVVHQEKIMTVDELVDRIKGIRWASIKAVEKFQIFKRQLIQIKGNREEIIKECENIINQ